MESMRDNQRSRVYKAENCLKAFAKPLCEVKDIEAPLATPAAGATYRRLEVEFLKLADAAEMEVADYDLMIWRKYSQK